MLPRTKDRLISSPHRLDRHDPDPCISVLWLMLKLSFGIPKAADSHGLLVGYNPTTVNFVV